jgi:hypothetical protein
MRRSAAPPAPLVAGARCPPPWCAHENRSPVMYRVTVHGGRRLTPVGLARRQEAA